MRTQKILNTHVCCGAKNNAPKPGLDERIPIEPLDV